MRSTRAGVPIVILYGLGLVAVLIFGPDIRARFKHEAVERGERKVENKKSQVQDQDAQQLEAGHIFIAGTNEALAHITSDQQTPAVKAATELGRKAESAIAAGRNADLTPEQRELITKTVEQMISPLVEDNKKARATITELEGKLNKSVSAEQSLRGELATLNKQLDQAKDEAIASAAFAENVLFWVKLAACIYVGAVWGLPLLTKFFPAIAPLNRGVQWVVNQAGAASMSALTATVRGVDKVREAAKQKGSITKEELDHILGQEIYDANDARIQEVRRQEGLV